MNLGVLGPETGVPPVRRGEIPRRKAIVRSAEGYVRGCAVLALPVLGGCVRPVSALPGPALLGPALAGLAPDRLGSDGRALPGSAPDGPAHSGGAGHLPEQCAEVVVIVNGPVVRRDHQSRSAVVLCSGDPRLRHGFVRKMSFVPIFRAVSFKYPFSLQSSPVSSFWAAVALGASIQRGRNVAGAWAPRKSLLASGVLVEGGGFGWSAGGELQGVLEFSEAGQAGGFE